MKLRVTNKQKYVLGRRGHVFPPGQTVEVEVSTANAYHEIKASRYLDVEVIEEAGDAETSLEELNVSDLRTLAEQYGVEVPARAKKADLITLVAEAKAAAEQSDSGSETEDDSGTDGNSGTEDDETPANAE